MEIALILQRSEHPDDRRLREPATLWVEAEAVPRIGESLTLPWPLLGRCGRQRVHATVEGVDHIWAEMDADTPDGPMPLLRVEVTATLFDPDITDGPWE